MRLIRWFRSEWADAGKSGEWMLDIPAFRSLSRWQRWNIRTQPRTGFINALMFLAVPAVIIAFALIALVYLLVSLLIEALT
jgi:hypothetical protein